jgi:hypothetical protein
VQILILYNKPEIAAHLYNYAPGSMVQHLPKEWYGMQLVPQPFEAKAEAPTEI